MDISPTTKGGIVDINIHEESHLQETYQELLQRFEKYESPESLRLFLIKAIERLVDQNQLLFYLYNYTTNTQSDITPEEAVKIINGNEVWSQDNENKLHAYRKKT